MPMYNFDVGEEDARWEADLLEDDREQQMALNVCLCWWLKTDNFIEKIFTSAIFIFILFHCTHVFSIFCVWL